MNSTIGVTVTAVVADALARLGNYLPQFIGGLIVLLVGLLIATLLKEVLLRFFGMVGLEKWLGQFSKWFRQPRTTTSNTVMWSNLLAELVRWTVVILFLVPAVEAWGLPKVTDVLNQVLLFLPNVFVAVVVGFVGFGIANLVYDVVKSATSELGSSSSLLLANMGRYSVDFFTALVVLNQLGVASDLVRILFTGIVAMLALAGGISFGLGGQDSARKILQEFAQKLSEVEVKTNEVRVRNNKGGKQR